MTFRSMGENADILSRCCMSSYLGLDTHRTCAELEAVEGLLRMLLRIRHCHHKRRLCVAAQRLLSTRSDRGQGSAQPQSYNSVYLGEGDEIGESEDNKVTLRVLYL